MSELPDYLQELEWLYPGFPKEAVDEAIERRDEATPVFLQSLERVADADVEGEGEYMLHIFAMYLLAQFREPRAFPLIELLYRRPHYGKLTGQVIVFGLDRILASTCGGKIEALKP